MKYQKSNSVIKVKYMTVYGIRESLFQPFELIVIENDHDEKQEEAEECVKKEIEDENAEDDDW